MTGAHRRPDEHPVRSTLKSVWWLFLLVGLIVASLAVVGIPVYLIVADSKFLPIATMSVQCLVVVVLGSQLARKVLRNRTPSPVVLADWIGDSAVVIVWVATVLAGIGQNQGWMHGAFEYALDSIFGLLLVGLPVYWWRGKQFAVLALTARAVAGRWPWSAGS